MTRSLALVSALLAVIAVAFAAVMFVVIRNAPDTPPSVSAFADGRAVEVAPFRYCPVSAPLCDYDGETATLPVRPGHPLQLSLPTAISNAPWGLATVYQSEGGDVVENDEFFLPDQRNSMTVPAVDTDGRALIGVEVRLPSGVIDTDTNQEEIVSHAIWSIATAPN
ncbi:DUF2771 family protein [Actinomycetes bacterium M1A6_2h]